MYNSSLRWVVGAVHLLRLTEPERCPVSLPFIIYTVWGVDYRFIMLVCNRRLQVNVIKVWFCKVLLTVRWVEPCRILGGGGITYSDE